MMPHGLRKAGEWMVMVLGAVARGGALAGAAATAGGGRVGGVATGRDAAPQPFRRGLRRLRMVLVCSVWLLAGAVQAAESRVLVLGDSLSAGYGIAASEGWVALLDARLQAERPGWRAVNASVSGETTAGGAARIDAELAAQTPRVVVIALGANDGLRGLPLEHARDNLLRMAGQAQAAGARVLLVGMRLPPNYGPDYTAAFEAMFRDVARTQGVALLPFLLEPIALDREAFQADNLHPVAAAQPALLAHVWPALAPLLAPDTAAATP